MKSVVTKRSIVINGHQTSVTLEDAFWTELSSPGRDGVEFDRGSRCQAQTEQSVVGNPTFCA